MNPLPLPLLSHREHFVGAVIPVLAVFLTSCASVKLPSVEIQPFQTEKNLAWKQVAEIALEHNPDILSAKAVVKSAALGRNIAAGDYLPSVDGVVNKSRNDTAAGRASDSLDVGIAASQNLFSGFETTGNFIQAQKDFSAEKWAYEETSANVRARLRTVYIEIIRLQRLLEVNRRIADRRKNNAELIRLRYEAGRENLGASMRANAVLDQADFEVRQTERRIESQFLRFGRELGGDFSYPVILEGELEKMIPIIADIRPDYVGLATEAPQVQRFVKIAESAKANAITAQSVIWPHADGTYDYTYSGDRASNLKRETFLGLSLTVPFFSGGKNIQGILQAQADYKAAWEAARSQRDETVVQLSETWVSYLDAYEQVDVQRHFLEASRKRSEIVRAQYSSGLSDFQEFDIAENDLTTSEKAYVQSLATALTSEVNWELLKGSTLEDVVRAA